MTAPNTYVIETVADLFKIPLNRLPACMSELTKGIAEFRRMNMETGVPLPDALQWIDDGREYVTLTVDGAPQVSIPLTPHDSDIERMLGEDQQGDIDDFDAEVNVAAEDGTLESLSRSRPSDPAADYTERSGRFLNRHERMAERDRVRNALQEEGEL